VDFSKAHAETYLEFQQRFEFPFFLCVAQHRKNKNLDLLIKTYAALKSQGEIDAATSLVLVGSSGPETEALNNLIQERSLESSVLMLSSINDHELCWLYQHCQIFVMPSSLEGFCIPLVEALSFGCKVVCSNIPIFQEIGSTDCTYFDLEGDTIQNLFQAIKDTLTKTNSPQLDTYIRFSKEKIAEEYIKFYAALT